MARLVAAPGAPAAPGVLVHRFSCPSPGGVTCLFTVTYDSLRRARSQLLSEADLPENHGCPNLFLPDHWSRHVKSAPLHVSLLHILSLARLACVHTWAWAATRQAPDAHHGPARRSNRTRRHVRGGTQAPARRHAAGVARRFACRPSRSRPQSRCAITMKSCYERTSCRLLDAPHRVP